MSARMIRPHRGRGLAASPGGGWASLCTDTTVPDPAVAGERRPGPLVRAAGREFALAPRCVRAHPKTSCSEDQRRASAHVESQKCSLDFLRLFPQRSTLRPVTTRCANAMSGEDTNGGAET